MDTNTCKCEDVTRQTRVKVPYFDCKLVKKNECRFDIIKIHTRFLRQQMASVDIYLQDCASDQVQQSNRERM